MKRKQSFSGGAGATARHRGLGCLAVGSLAVGLMFLTPLAVQAVGISPGHWDVTMIQDDPTPLHQNFALSFWPDPGVCYLLTTDLFLGAGVGAPPFDADDLFYSYDPVVRVTHLEWVILETAESLQDPTRPYAPYGNLYVDAFPFTVYLHSATMDPTVPGSGFYGLDTICLLQSDYVPGSGSGMNFNTGLIIPIHITVEPATPAVPVPGALVLGAFGLSCAGWRLRHMKA